MRKTVLYWQTEQITLLEEQASRLKSLQAIYPQLIISSTAPTTYNLRYDYVRLTNSESQPRSHTNLVYTLVYCLHLDSQNLKSFEIKKKYEYQEPGLTPASSMGNQIVKKVHITNKFNELLRIVIEQLGYEVDTDQLEKKIVNQMTQHKMEGDSTQNRFQLAQKKDYLNESEFVPRDEFAKAIRELQKVFTVEANVEKMPIDKLAKQVETQLRQYLKSKSILPIEKQFAKIREAKSLLALCRSCLHFYTLEKLALYQNLNLLLKNIRSTTFKQKFQQLRLYAFLMILNYFFVYSGSGEGGDDYQTPAILYRYTDATVDDGLVGALVTIPSFFSVSQEENLQSFASKPTKIIIHPLAQNSSISIRSLFPIHLFSAFKKQREHLYVPFTSFQVVQIVLKRSSNNKVVYLKEVPGNQFVKSVLDINLLRKSGKLIKEPNSMAEWQLAYQHQYEFHKQPMVKIKVSYNLGVIHYKFLEKYEIAIKYFEQGLQIASRMDFDKKSKPSMLCRKGYNYLGLTFMRMNDFKKARANFSLALPEEAHYSEKSSSDYIRYFASAVLNNLAALLELEEKFDLAIQKYQQSLKILGECRLKNELMEACVTNNIGTCLMKKEGPYVPEIVKEKSPEHLSSQQSQLIKKVISSECLEYYLKSMKKYLRIYGKDCLLQPKVEQLQTVKQLQHLANQNKQQELQISELIPILENISEYFELNYLASPKAKQLCIFFQEKAIEAYKACKVVEEAESQTFMYMQARLAKIYNKFQLYQRSLENYEKVLDIARMNDASGVILAAFKTNMASVCVSIGEEQSFLKALLYYEQAIKEISSPLLSENLEFYNKVCDMKKQLEQCLGIWASKDSLKERGVKEKEKK